MTEAQAVELMWEQFDNNWPTLSNVAAGAPVPRILENEALDQTLDTFAMLTAIHTVSAQITAGAVGSRRVERRGYLSVKVWVKTDSGRKLASQLLDVARTIFECTSISSPPGEPITIQAGSTQEVGSDGRWYTAVVKFPFRYYATV